jgi:hypothetical protein
MGLKARRQRGVFGVTHGVKRRAALQVAALDNGAQQGGGELFAGDWPRDQGRQ